MAPRPARGRPPTLTPEAIARAVLEVGFPHLTFAAVSEHLGVGQTTLFRHAKDRDGLVRLALDSVIERIEWPPLEGDWREVLESHALAAWRGWEAHPGSATEVSRGVVPSAVPRLMDDLCAMLMRNGFTGENAVLACDVVFDLVADSRRGVEHIDELVPSVGTGRERLHELWEGAPRSDASTHSATPAQRDEIRTAMHGAITAEPLDWFRKKLRIVLAGIEHTLI